MINISNPLVWGASTSKIFAPVVQRVSDIEISGAVNVSFHSSDDDNDDATPGTPEATHIDTSTLLAPKGFG